MANPGAGTKFLSVNLNKSYGQQHYNSNNTGNQHHTSSYGSNRGTNRPGGGGGSGGMVVLSRPRSSHKAAGPKLSVPPPLNLPSLRKEHERFDSLGSGGGHSGGGSGIGPRPSSSGLGWSKPAAAIALQEKEGGAGGDHAAVDNGTANSSSNNNSNNYGLDHGMSEGANGNNKGSGFGGSVYMPPSARLQGTVVSGPSEGYSVAEKATVLRGEDFPSLKASLPVISGAEKKQKDGLIQKHKQNLGEELANEQRGGSQLSTHVEMRPQSQSKSRNNVNNGLDHHVDQNRGFGPSILSEKDRQQEDHFPEPLPLVRLNPRSDWADDERDTGLGFRDRGREQGFTKSEPYWERDFDFPRPSVLPQKPVHNVLDKRGQRDGEFGKISSGEVSKADTYGKDAMTPSRDGREGNSWRASSPLQKDGISSQEIGNERNSSTARPSVNRETTKEKKYVPSAFREHTQDEVGRREVGYGHGGKQPWNNTADSFGSRRPEWNTRERYGNEQYNRYRGDAHQNSAVSRSSLSSGSKVLPNNDPMMNFGREKRPFTKSEKPYLEDPFTKDFGAANFDGRDPFSGGLVGLVKKKKDVLKQSDFHDPVRESFEAELERVQKMQEQERQRIIEEQERAMELARREEEERMRQVREQEEQQRRLEEEAREAAWRAEQERLEAMQRAEEQRIAREEEKRKILIEEERRKQAAKQKLLDLEARMAKRNAEAVKGGDSSSGVTAPTSEKDDSKVFNAGTWEDSERMVERLTTSASSDSSGINRPFEAGPRHQFPRDGSSAFLDRGKSPSSWKRDVFENGNSSGFLTEDQENGHQSPRRDGSVGGRGFPRKDFYGGTGFMSSRPSNNRGAPASYVDEFSHVKGQRWNVSGDDRYSRNSVTESDFHDNLGERFGDAGWGQDYHRGNPYHPYSDRMFQNPDSDGVYSVARSRYPVRQPHVPPPVTTSPMHKVPFRGVNERPNPSNFLETEIHYDCRVVNESTMDVRYDRNYQENFGQAEITDTPREDSVNEEHLPDRNAAARCDSQSSLSVSSPPDSPVHLSHDDLDDSGDSPLVSAGQGKDDNLLGLENEPVALPSEVEKENVMSGSSTVYTGDDEEWAVANDEKLQEPEEYDEDEDGYEEEDDVHDGEDETVNLNQEFENMHLEEKGSSNVDNLVLGFNEGVEVGMPSDEFERTSRHEETRFLIPQVPVVTKEEQGYFDGIHGGGGTLQPMDGSAQLSNDASSRIFQETEKPMQDVVIQSKSSTQTSKAVELMDLVDASTSSGLSSQPQILSSSGQTLISTVPSQPEVPLNLQFGLFSGPSLIPSPVPAIQIGSIQMPLHLHPPVGPSLSHIHQSQPPLFQFGQLRYTSPMSQGVLPLPPQSMSFVQHNVAPNFSLNQSVGGPLTMRPVQETSAHNVVRTNVLPTSANSQPGLLPQNLDMSCGVVSKDGNPLLLRESIDDGLEVQQGQRDSSHVGDRRADSGTQAKESFVKNLQPRHTDESGWCQTEGASSHLLLKEKDSGAKGQGLVSGGRGKRYIYTVRNSGSRSSPIQVSEMSRHDSNGFQRRLRRQRTEFRVREAVERRQRTEFRVYEAVERRESTGVVSSSGNGVDNKSNIGGRRATGARIGSRRIVVSDRQPKQSSESEGLSSRPVSSHKMNSGSKLEKEAGSEPLSKIQNISLSTEDVDAPLQSGIVRVFQQPGIEAPSDDDDFIEVRSKRQMLNDRREQREKEIKAKSRVSKMPRKLRSSSQSTTASVASGKAATSFTGESSNSIGPNFRPPKGHPLANAQGSAGFKSPVITQPLPPIGTPAKPDVQPDIRSQAVNKSLQSNLQSVVAGSGKNPSSGLIFESKNKVLDNVQPTLGAWGNSRLNQQVMALTQSQLDEAMKPVQVDSCSSGGDPAKKVSEPSLASSSMLTKEKTFSSAPSPVNSLLAGEKIQFGAVTSPTILPASICAVSHGIGPPGPSRSDIHPSHKIAAVENGCSLFVEKDKHSSESCPHLEDCEAEAEAAASAVAVAAISSDEIVGNGLGAGSVSTGDSKGFGGPNIDGISITGGSGDQQLASQSRAEESLSVALPADLSVENPPISLWPPLPSPQNSSSQMLSHVPGGPPSHFPFYEMNPMLGGPIFAFGPHDESASNQSQNQKSGASVSGPLGTWQHHAGVDSFYGPPAGFTGPFISPPGTIPAVQGPPHMVVYNHFAPVGQFGQVGLSFMGTTYIPSGKQPDWNHNPATSAVSGAEGDVNNLNMASGQRNPPNMPASIQHLAPGSPLLPMPSPLAMFDVSPFQSAHDMSVQARWSHVPPSPLQSVPVSMPLQQQAEGVLPSQFNHGPPVDQPLAANRFPESRTSTPADNSRNFPTATDATVTQLPDELGLVESSSSTSGGNATQSVIAKSSSVSNNQDAGKSEKGSGGSSSGQSTNSSFKPQPSHQKNTSAQQYNNSSGYNYQKGGGSHKNTAGGEWSHRRMGYQGRNQSLGAEKSFPPSKTKQIYVAKQTTTGKQAAS